MISVTKKFHFSYAHHLPNYSGDCKNLHGHNSDVEVEFSNNFHMPRAYDGMIIDFKDIKEYVKPIIDYLDHSYLNDLFSFNPTAENIVQWIVEKIQETPISSGLTRVRVSETNDSYAEWRK